MKLNVKGFALTAGILWGLAMFVGTLLVLAFGHHGESLGLLKSAYVGYRISMGGAFIGLIYGFISAFIAGGLFAWLYNKFAG